MNEDPCPHGYIPASCAECRRPDLVGHYDAEHRGKTRAQLDARRTQCIARAAELGDYEHPSQAQRAEFDGLTAETIVLDGLIKADDVEIRRAKIADITRMAQDEGNLERPDGGSHAHRRPGPGDQSRYPRREPGRDDPTGRESLAHGARPAGP